MAPFNEGTDKVLKHQKHLNEGFLYAVCQSPFFKQFLQNFTKFIRKLKNMDGLCYFKSFIVFGPGTIRLFVHVRNRKRLKSCTEDLNINLRSPRHTLNINDTFLYVGLRGGEVEQTTFHYENHAIY